VATVSLGWVNTVIAAGLVAQGHGSLILPGRKQPARFATQGSRLFTHIWPGGSVLCFCYGSNMSKRRLQARVPSARFFAVAELPGHRLRFHKAAMDGSAKCDAEETGDPNDRVIGVIYDIADNEKPDLDRHEALGRGYEEKQVELLVAGERRLHAWMYFATRINDSLKPFHWYKDHVLVGARENGLPADYIALIEAVEAIEDPRRSRRERELGIYRDTGALCLTGTDRGVNQGGTCQ
jgi:gamma-glutamylcyclotransferase (GGCT)/AIG2-like uncharacterized protein YtfP